MDLDRISAAVRPRSPWEAIDLGLQMVRANYTTMLLSSLLITVPLYLVVTLLLFRYPIWVGVVLWWLKPIWERTHLHLLSRSLFGEVPTVRETVRAFPGYGWKQWLAWLTVRRFTGTRSLNIPVTMLEGLDGSERRKRLAVLHRGAATSGAAWLTVVCVHVEGFLILSFVAIVQLFIPVESGGSVFNFLLDGAEWASVAAQNFAGLLASVLVAPFFVGAGFSLYINRRTILEGWDIEIAFRRLADRLSRAERGARSVQVAVAMLTFVAAHVGSSAALAADARQLQAEPAASREAIHQVLEGEDFHEVRVLHLPKFLVDLDWTTADEEEEPMLPEWLRSLLHGITSAVAWSFETVLVAVALGLLAYLAFRYRRVIAGIAQEMSAAGSKTTSPPSVLFGLEVTEESLPDDVTASVLALWREGHRREACALFYRAALVEMITRQQVELGVGLTEGECVRAVADRVTPDLARLFSDLTRQWQLLAYGHREPSDATIAELCARWGHCVGEADPAVRGSTLG